MEEVNRTSPAKFILLGLSNVPYLQAIFFLLFLLMYIITLSGNLLLIVVVRINPKLQTPMYFFLSNLAFNDINYSSTIVPKILINTLSQDRSISLTGCAVQIFCLLILGVMECCLLAVMAYDRFVAICRPLHYNTIMNMKLCASLVAGSWSMSILNSTLHVALTFQLPYCKSHYIDHFFCEMPPLFRLSCQDTLYNEIIMYISGAILGSCALCLTLTSYVHIISTVLKIRSSEGRHKAFSTCASHLTVLALYYGTVICIYLKPRSTNSANVDKSASILYTVVTPMLNPIIYSIRNKDVKNTVKNNSNKKQSSLKCNKQVQVKTVH
ncbi:olfactory receptor 1361-like [Rana temporaria]|uniref:olfactory receptor 1361-like n=1 Tax=Rana temporaria TaxID=8407 RepID=UPI001AAC4EEC|nr:olfactory receptor 1361-like [Rana temporaria]